MSELGSSPDQATTITPRPHLSGAGGPRRRSGVLRLLGQRLGAWLGHESIPQMAAALAYRTIFSLIPVLILSLLVLRLFQDEREVIRTMLGRVLELAGLSQLQLGDAQEVSVQARLEELVSSFSGLSFTGIGLVSSVTLIYAAISLIVEVENSFNRIYGSVRGRSWARRLTQYWMLLTLGPLLVFASFYTAERFIGFAQSLARGGAGGAGGAGGSGGVFYAWLLGGAGYLVSVAITSLLLLVVYAIVPNTLVRWRAAAAGAVLAAVLLELGKYGFKLYLDHAGYKSLYGSLALVPLFLLWVYITWVVVLFGLRSAYLIQHGKRLALFSLLEERAGPGLAGSGFADPGAALLIMQQAASAFARGTSVDVASLASATALPQGVVERAVTSLCDAGLLLAVAERSGAQRVTLARPAETIALGDVLNVGHGLVSAGAPAGVMGELRRAQAAALAGRTLAELVEAPAGPAAKTRAGARTEASQAVQTRADDGAVGPAFQEVARAQ